jgi:eukaryotic-like serine/threonine-protein kinase
LPPIKGRNEGPLQRAFQALFAGDHERALTLLPSAEVYMRTEPAWGFVRAQALMRGGRFREAADAFAHVHSIRLTRAPTVIGPATKIWQARALAKAGDAAGARTAYQDAFGIWKDAEPDLPLLVEARREYAAFR